MVGSKGDEDVVEDDGSQRVLTRSLQNWHTHLAMQLNAQISAMVIHCIDG